MERIGLASPRILLAHRGHLMRRIRIHSSKNPLATALAGLASVIILLPTLGVASLAAPAPPSPPIKYTEPSKPSPPLPQTKTLTAEGNRKGPDTTGTLQTTNWAWKLKSDGAKNTEVRLKEVRPRDRALASSRLRRFGRSGSGRRAGFVTSAGHRVPASGHAPCRRTRAKPRTSRPCTGKARTPC